MAFEDASDIVAGSLSAAGELVSNAGETVSGVLDDWDGKDVAYWVGGAFLVGLGALAAKKLYDKVTE